MIRAFVAVKISPALEGRVGELLTELALPQYDVKWVRPENLHLTLKFLGNVEEGRVEAIAEVIGEVARSSRPFRLRLGGLGAFPNIRRPRVIWAGMTEGARRLEGIAEGLEAGLGRLGFAREKRRFSAHLTLGRTRSARGLNELVRRVNRYSNFELGEMQIEDVSLFASELRPAGPVYTGLFKAALGGGVQEGGVRS